MKTGWAGVSGAGAVVVLVSAGGDLSFFEQAPDVNAIPARARYPNRTIEVVTGSLLWNPEHLPRVDEVGIVDLVPVGIEDPPPRVRVAVFALGNLRKAVSLHHRVGAFPLRAGRG